MTVYAWIGRKDGDDFDDDIVDFSLAEATSAKGASSIGVQRDFPDNALEIALDTFVVDLNRQSSVEFTIQLQDEDGNALELEGVEIEVEVDSGDITVNAAAITEEDGSNIPLPAYRTVRGGDDFNVTTLLTDNDGEVVFELDAPRKFGRLDEVLINPACDCRTETIGIAWSAGAPVLVVAERAFDSYQFRIGTNIRFNVDYYLYDQYGNALSSTNSRQTGRGDTTVKTDLSYTVYSVADNGLATPVPTTGEVDLMEMSFRGGRFTDTVNWPIPDNQDDNLMIVLEPFIISDDPDDTCVGDQCVADQETEVEYVDSEEIVWIVEDAKNPSDRPETCPITLPGNPAIKEVEVNVAEQEFRTCFTVWSYDSGDRFLGAEGAISIDEFEERLKNASTVAEIRVSLYSSSLRVFEVD